jgi:hypothetical protein
MEQQTESNPVEQKVQEQVTIENKNSETSSNKEETSPKSSADWQKFREARAQERKQAEEMQRQAEKSAAEASALKAALEAIVSKPSPQQNQNNYYDQEETEEQRIDKRVNDALAKRDAEYERQRKEREHQEFPQKLQSTFSDFNQVCSTENLDYLEYHYPEVAEAFKHSPDGYQKWAAVYKAVKRFVPNIDGRKEMARAEANLAKPQSISSPTASTSGQGVGASRLDDGRKRANWERMQKQMKGIN